MKEMSEVLVLKVGTSTIVEDDCLDQTSVEGIARQIDKIRLTGRGVILVSSAARKQLPDVGWEGVLEVWDANTQHQTEGYLLTDHQLDSENGCGHVIAAARAGRIAVTNAHDDRLAKESRYVSNDLVGAAIATQASGMGVRARFGMLTDVHGVLSDLSDPSSVISTIDDIDAYRQLAGDTNSSGATGGMVTKFDAAALTTAAGIETWIAHGRADNAIEQAMNGQIGTTFRR
ncbi:MAG TPA: hypothetical protein VK694_05670 [Verrucomicrobiae bacterium]|nr:hypothetical protein [Verrucomicrobiae bacterium]